MPKREIGEMRKLRGQRVGKRNAFIAIGVLLGLTLAGAAFAQWGGLFTPQKQRTSGRTATPPASPTPQSLNANRPPAKEYVYAGGRLLATEACGYELSAASAFFPVAGGTGSVNVTAANGCAWSVARNASWLQTTPSSGNGNGTVNYTVGQGASDLARQGTVTIGDLMFTVVQGIDCTASVSPTAPATFPSGGGSGSLTVTTISNRCGYAATSSASWVTLTSCCGLGLNGTVAYVVAPNPGAARTATITINAGSTPTMVTIKQKSGL